MQRLLLSTQLCGLLLFSALLICIHMCGRLLSWLHLLQGLDHCLRWLYLQLDFLWLSNFALLFLLLFNGFRGGRRRICILHRRKEGHIPNINFLFISLFFISILCRSTFLIAYRLQEHLIRFDISDTHFFTLGEPGQRIVYLWWALRLGILLGPTVVVVYTTTNILGFLHIIISQQNYLTH